MEYKNKVVGYYDEGEDSFLCKDCFKQLQTQGGYKKVKKKSLKNQTYTCNRCGRTFTENRIITSSKKQYKSDKHSYLDYFRNNNILAFFSFLIGVILIGMGIIKAVAQGIGVLFIIGGIIGIILSAISLEKKLVRLVSRASIALAILLSSLTIPDIVALLTGETTTPLLNLFEITVILVVGISIINLLKMKKVGLYAFIILNAVVSIFLSYLIYSDITTYLGLGLQGYSVIFVPPLGLSILFLVYFLRVREKFK